MPLHETELADAIALGGLGTTVRCTPQRRTVMVELPGGRVVFGKVRVGRAVDARAEWRWLHLLPMSGFRVPQPLGLSRVAGLGVLLTEAAPGRPLDALWLEAAERGELADAVGYACEVVAPMVRRLHERRLVFRDLYWNHLFAEAMRPGAAEPVMIDVERVLQPRWRHWRWRVKDLAGLLASLPVPLRAVDQLRFLRRYFDGLPADWHGFANRVVVKARRIREHRPKYG